MPYEPYPREEAINEPDDTMTALEISCVYPEEPGFASRPFFLGDDPNPWQIYVHQVTKKQDIYVDLGTVNIYRDGTWVTEPYFVSILTGSHPTDAWDAKDSYFPPSCPQQLVTESDADSPEADAWSILSGWNYSGATINGVLVTLRDADGERWPQIRNYQNMSSLGTLVYIIGDCDDWAIPNPRDVSKTITVKTPVVNGTEQYFDCNQYRYAFYGAQYQPMRPPSIVPTIGLGLAMVFCGVAGTLGVGAGGGGRSNE